MKKYISHLLFILIAIFIISCEKNIDVDFPPGERPYVIEGYIENGVVPLVTISRGFSFLSNITSDDFNGVFVNNAIVTISIDNGVPINLTPINVGGVVIYSNPVIIGEIGRKYDLNIEVDGKTFTSTTRILTPVPLDSISMKPAEGDKYLIDSLVELTAWYTDPPQLGNYYRIMTKKNSEFLYDVSFNSIANDLLLNGKQNSFTIFGSKAQLQNNDTADFSQFGYFKRGDTVYVKWSAIDQAQYNFWDTFESQGSSFGNPFAPTVIINSNVKGKGSIGVWAGYGAYIDTVIIP